MRILCAVLSFCWLASIEGLALSRISLDRRIFIERQGAIISGIGAGFVATVAKPAYADVSDGNALPDGAAQFSRILRLKADIVGVNKRLVDNTKTKSIDKNEWDNISDFMRLVYRCGEDMKIIAKASIYDTEKKKKADEVIQLLQKLAQTSDSAVSKEDSVALISITKKISVLVDDFFELLRDVPDEI